MIPFHPAQGLMRRHYLDAEEIGALLDTSGRRGNAEEMLVPRAGRNKYQKDGINVKNPGGSDVSLQKYDPSVRFSLLISHQHRAHLDAMFLFVLFSKAQPRQKVERCSLPWKTQLLFYHF